MIALGRTLKYVLGAILFVLLMTACAATKPETRDEVCFVQYLGKTEQGWVVGVYRCMTPEAFAESQK